MKYLFLYFSFLIILSCKEKPNYNPFDEQFNVSVNALVSDKSDTIWGTCGYYGLAKKNNRLNMYYAFYGESGDKVLGKGFEYIIDTIKVKANDLYINDGLNDSIIALPINKKYLNVILDEFGYEVLNQNDNEIIMFKNQDTVFATIGFEDFQTRYVIRKLYFNKQPQQ